MRMTAGFLTALMAASACGLVHAQDLGREWRALSATETSLVFAAPGLESAGKRFMESDAQDYSHSTEVGIWASPSSLFPKAQLILQKLSPGYSFTYGIEIENFINRLEFVVKRNPSIGAKQSTSNSIGEILYRKFTFDDFECIAFGQNFGDLAYEARVLDYLDLLFGFYCGDSGKKLSSDMITQVVRSIGVKGVATPN